MFQVILALFALALLQGSTWAQISFSQVIKDQIYLPANFSIMSSRSIISSSSPDETILIQNCTFECANASPQALTDFSIDASATLFHQEKSLFEIANSASVKVQNSTFKNCYLNQRGGIFRFENSSVEMLGVSFLNNAAAQGGVIYSKQSNLTIQDGKFISNWALEGGSIYLEESNNVTLTNIQVMENFAFKSGGFLSAFSEAINPFSITKSQLLVQNFSLSNNSAVVNGGTFAINCTKIEISLKDGFIKNSTASTSDLTLNAASKAEIIQIQKASRLTLQYVQISQNFQEVRPAQVAGSLILIKSDNQYFSSDIQDCSFTIQESPLPLANIENICFSNQDIADSNSYSYFVSQDYGSLVSRNNSFSQNGKFRYQSTFLMSNGIFQDDSSKYANMALNSSAILTCNNCSNVTFSNLQFSQAYSCQSPGVLIYLRDIKGNFIFQNASVQVKALTSLQHLIYLGSSTYTRSNFILRNITLNDQSDFQESGLLFFSKNALIDNLTVSDITVIKREYFSQLISASALNSAIISNIGISLSKDMKSEKLFQDQTGIINIPLFSSIQVVNISLACSSYKASQYEMILGKKQSASSPFNHLYNPLVRLQGLDKTYFPEFCSQAGRNCTQTRADFQYIKMESCYNFENGVFLQCSNCWSISTRNSSFDYISKVPEYNGLKSGFFHTDWNLTQFSILYSNFSNIVTEGNMIMESYMLEGLMSFNFSNFNNVHSTLKKGGFLIVAYETQMMEKLYRTNENYFNNAAKLTAAIVSWSIFRNISSNNEGSIFYQRPFYLRKIDMYDVEFHNVTSEKAGAILRVEGNMYYRAIIRRAVFRACFSYGGGVFDYDYTILQGPFFYNLNVQCFPPDSDLIVNALEKKHLFQKLPGPFIQIRMFRQYVGIQTSTFSNCVTFEKGAIINVVEHDLFFSGVSSNFYRSVYVLGSNFYNNSAQQGGAVSSQVGDPSFVQCNFINNTAVIGGAVSVETPIFWGPCDTVVAINNRAYLKGGFMSITQDKLIRVSFDLETYFRYPYDYYFDYSNFQNNSAIYGGAFSIEAELVHMQFYKSSFSNQRASIGGDVYFIYSYYIYYYSSSSFGSRAKQGSVLYIISEETNDQHEIYNTVIDCKNQETPNLITGRGTFILLDYFKVQNCRAEEGSSLISFKNTYLIYNTRSNYTNNSGSLGGVFFLQNALLSNFKTGFVNNSATMGGAIYLGGDAKILDNQAYYKSNRAILRGGAIYGSSNASLEIYQSQYWNNVANEGSAIFIVGARASRSNEKIESIDVQGSLFSNNTSNISTITIFQGNSTFISNRFQDNYAKNSSNAVVALMANLFFRSNTFTSSPAVIEQYKPSASLQGGYIYAIFSVNLTLASITIQNGLSKQGAAIYLGSQSFANLTRVLFQNNTAIDKGGVIYAKDTKHFNIDLCQFYNNTAQNIGEEIYLQKTNEPFILSSTIFKNHFGRQLIYAEQANVSFSNVTMTSLQFNQKYKYGGAMYFQNSDQIRIVDSSFQNFQAEQGGAIYVWESSVNLQNRIEGSQKYQNKNHSIINTTFSNCSSFKGGAIFLENSNSFTITDSSFTNNSAYSNAIMEDSGNGGAIFLTSYGTSNLTQLYLSNNNTYTSNRAEGKGGVFYWDELEPYYILENQLIQHFSDLNASQNLSLRFVNNSANLYGKNFASFASRLKYYKEKMSEAQQRILQNQEPIDNYTLVEVGFDLRFQNFRSGEALREMKLAIVDIYDQIIVSDNSSVVQVLVDTKYNTDQGALKYPPIIEGTNSFKAEQGIFSLSDMTFYSSPGYNHSIQILSSTIDLSKEANQILMQKMNTSDLGQRIVLELRECVLGEMFSPAGKCQYCQSPTYILEKAESPVSCIECPQNSICLGGNVIGPKPGFWRSKNTTVYQVQCLKSEACLGFIPPYSNLLGNCAEGYQGTLCADCKMGYVRGKGFECESCPSDAITYVKLFSAGIGWILLCVLLVYSTYLSSKSKLVFTNIYLKMLLNHFQLLMVSWSLNFQIANELILLGQDIIKASTVSSLFLNFECLLQRDQNSEPFIGEIRRISSLKMIILTFLPLFCLFICYGAFIFYRTQFKKNSLSLLISSTVISLFIVYPSVIHRVYLQFQYRELDKIDRLVSDLEIERGSAEHIQTALYFCLPSFLVWGLGIPALAFKVLYDLKEKLDKQFIASSFGFLYRGFQRQFRYWEAVISFRKLLILIVITITRDLGIIIQTLFVIVVYTIFMFLNLNLRPFSISDFFMLENLSLFVQIATLYLSLYLSVDKPQEWADQQQDSSNFSIQLSPDGEAFFVYMIIIINASYFLVWIVLLLRNSKSFFLSKFTKSYLVISRKKMSMRSSVSSIRSDRDSQMTKIKEEEIHQLFLEEYHALVLQIQDLYQKGLKMNEESISRIRNYLNKERVRNIVINRTFQSINPQEQSYKAIDEDLRFESDQNENGKSPDQLWSSVNLSGHIPLKKLQTKSFKSKGKLSFNYK